MFLTKTTPVRTPLLMAALGMTAAASTDRVSLNGIDAKLDQLLAARLNVSNHVTLKSQQSDTSNCGYDRAYHRVNLDGTTDSTGFVVPANHTLLLYDIEWEASRHPTQFYVGWVLMLWLIAMNPNGLGGQYVYYSPKIENTTRNQNGKLGASDSVTAGVAVGAGRIVCAYVTNSSQSGTGVNRVSSSILRDG